MKGQTNRSILQSKLQRELCNRLTDMGQSAVLWCDTARSVTTGNVFLRARRMCRWMAKVLFVDPVRLIQHKPLAFIERDLLPGENWRGVLNAPRPTLAASTRADGRGERGSDRALRARCIAWRRPGAERRRNPYRAGALGSRSRLPPDPR